MKRTLTLGVGLLALASSALTAGAADLGVRPIARAPVIAPVSVYNWTGFYVGGHLGGAWADKDWTDVTPGFAPFPLGTHTASGFLGGGQAGINFQWTTWVFGVEAQWSWTNADATHACDPTFNLSCRTEINWLGTVAGRVGYAFDRALLYVKGGAAFINENYTQLLTNTGVAVAATGDVNRTGWMVGAGVEWAFANNWSAKIEYNFMDFGNDTFNLTTLTPPVGVFTRADIDQQVHVVKAGVNYRFDWGKAVVARY